MMFVQQKNNAIYRVSLTLERVLSPFWNLSRHLLDDKLLRDRDYTRFDADFEHNKENRLGKCDADFQKLCENINSGEESLEEKQKWITEEDRSKYDSVFLEAFDCVLKYYYKRILSSECFSKQIKNSCSIIVYKPQGECRFITEGDTDERFGKEFKKCLFSMNIVDDFLQFLNGGISDPNSYNQKVYSNVFPNNYEDDAVSIESPIYSKGIYEAKDSVVRQSSDYQIWYNKTCLKSLGYEEPNEGVVFEYRVDDSLIALEQGDFLIPMVTEWRNHFSITNNAKLIWTNYLNRLYNTKERGGNGMQVAVKNRMTEDERAFIEAAASEDFTNVLSYLIDNLYLPDNIPELDEGFKQYFHPLKKIENLKHLVDYRLFVPNQDQDGTVLGVYKIHKLEGESEYNLRHMLYSHQVGGKQVISDYNDEQRIVTTVQVLKPQFASFYMKDYYEFFVEEVLKALKSQGVIKDYLRNQRFSYKGQGGYQQVEIDALVFNGKRIFLLELKTMLHIEFLNSYPQRYASLLANEEATDFYEFYLISSFADDNIAVLKLKEDGVYNVRREGLKTVPYRFNVAIPVKDKTKAKDLHCLCESSFSKLKIELERVFSE